MERGGNTSGIPVKEGKKGVVLQTGARRFVRKDLGKSEIDEKRGGEIWGSGGVGVVFRKDYGRGKGEKSTNLGGGRRGKMVRIKKDGRGRTHLHPLKTN